MTTQPLDEPPTSGVDLESPVASEWESRVIVVRSDWYSERPPPRDWLLRDARAEKSSGVLLRGCVGLLVAQGGAGKTMALTQLAVSIATGRAWLGSYVVARPGRALLVLGEEDASECRRRLWRAVISANRTRPGAVRSDVVPPVGAIHCMALAGIDCALIAGGGVQGDPIETEFARALRVLVERERYDAVLIDPLSRFGGRDVERDNAAATRAIQVLESIAAHGATVIAAHHTAQWDRGRGRAEATAAAARGVTGITDGARWVMRFGVERFPGVDEHLREIVTAEVVKTNYARRPDAVEVRRDVENGGALVELDDVDREMIAEARTKATVEAKRSAERERKRLERDALDDQTLRAIKEEQPDIGARTLRDEMKRRLGQCGRERVDAALARHERNASLPLPPSEGER